MNSITQEHINVLLKERFEKHPRRHPGLMWSHIEQSIHSNKDLVKALIRMEETGGEPDVTTLGGKLVYVDFSKETPEGRRNLCYDEEARLSRKKFPPATSAEKLALAIGIELLDEDMYHELQRIEPLDLKTSSWLKSPQAIRDLGGALFGDRRYNRTFTYHNGADSYYGVRGFRGYIVLS
ncbi:MAG TPA: DUF4256 domain-containing protein [Acholeplasmataceae bacterium]|nr:DUF4256 domain-containing protein [Acholeplasmataceae bacterium]